MVTGLLVVVLTFVQCYQRLAVYPGQMSNLSVEEICLASHVWCQAMYCAMAMEVRDQKLIYSLENKKNTFKSFILP